MHTRRAATADPILETRNANLTLASGRAQLHILKDVSLSVQPAEVVAVVGPSGSGKTSLLMLLAGLERATTGEVVVNGQSLSGMDEDELAVFRRRTMGIVFQSFHLVPSMTALENVRLALEIAEVDMTLAEMTEAATAILNEVGLGGRLTHLPRALSGGEQQRVGLARALVTQPKLLLADEPTGNLDQDTGAKAIELMFASARKMRTAVLLITHDDNLAARADRRLVMDRGQLTETDAVVRS